MTRPSELGRGEPIAPRPRRAKRPGRQRGATSVRTSTSVDFDRTQCLASIRPHEKGIRGDVVSAAAGSCKLASRCSAGRPNPRRRRASASERRGELASGSRGWSSLLGSPWLNARRALEPRRACEIRHPRPAHRPDRTLGSDPQL
jgi:hypothetical protein